MGPDKNGTYAAMNEAQKKLSAFRLKYPTASFYVQGSIGGQEDSSPDHKVAIGRALSAVAWLTAQGVPLDKVFAYAVIPAAQTKFGHGGATINVCDVNRECACPNGIEQRLHEIEGFGRRDPDSIIRNLNKTRIIEQINRDFIDLKPSILF